MNRLLILMNLLLTGIFSYCQDNADQHFAFALKRPLIKAITEAATESNYYVKFIGIDKLIDTVYLYGSYKPDLQNLLEILRNQRGFSFKIQHDTITIDDYYIIDLDSSLQGIPFITTYYDSTRDSQVLAFQHISPSALFDNMKWVNRGHQKHKLFEGVTVTGLIPLNEKTAGIWHTIMKKYKWSIERDNGYGILHPAGLTFDDVKDLYQIDSSKTGTSFIKTTFNGSKSQIIFNQVNPYDVLTKLAKTNGYCVKFHMNWKRLPPVSGMLPAHLPIQVLIKLICEKHQLCCEMPDERTGYFVRCNEAFYETEY